MAYILKQFDTALMWFEMQNTFSGLEVQILHINEEKRHLLPLDLAGDNSSLLRWLKQRTIPSNRAYVQNFLAKMGLSEKDVKGILDLCYGLSLNDSYWVVPDGFTGSFAQHNLFSNKLSRTLALMAFTGFGSYERSSIRTSPEFTTGGMLPKAWRRERGRILLYKGGTEGAANSGNEPYSEYYAYQVAETMGVPVVRYGLSMWKNRLCSTCELFTSQEISYIPAGRLIGRGDVREVLVYYQNLGGEYYESLIDMFVLDAVICNRDRHMNNFGLLIENRDNQIIATAPVFDNGLSLFPNAMRDDLIQLDLFAKTCTPALYPDHVTFAKEVMGKRQREMLRKLASFRFTKHPRYNLPDERLRTIEGFVRQRASTLLS